MCGIRLYCRATISALTRTAPLDTFILRVQSLDPAFFTTINRNSGAAGKNTTVVATIAPVIAPT